jgi:hypothetical protein
VEKLTGALREGGILIYTDNSMPMDVLRTWGNHPWWGRFFAMVEPNDCVRFMESGYPLRVVAREQYLRDPRGRDQLIALFQKGTAASERTLEDPGVSVASPARTS